MLTFPPDATFVIQIISFFVLWFGLKRLLFDPVLGVLEERETRTSGAQQAASEMTEATQETKREYEVRLQEVRRRLASASETARSATEDEERRIVSEARGQAGTRLTEVREELQRATHEAEPGLGPEAQNLAKLMLERVLGRAA
jgi:F-type H+-transporting ATPase subunit b